MKARPLLRRAPFGVVALSALALASRSEGAPDDPADRGLDAYVEMPRSGVVGATIAVDLRTFGFRTTVKPEPLGKVTVDAAWSDGDPTPVSIVTNDAGTGQLLLTIPDGATSTARLVIGLTYDGGHGVHRRTREFSVERTPRHVLDLRLPSSKVTPGTKLPVWLGVVDVLTGALAPGVPVHLALEEGGAVQRSVHLTTNDEGVVTTMLDVPETDQPSIGWTLRASTDGGRDTPTKAHLDQFEYVPSRPQLRVRLDARRLAAGGKTVGRVRLRDASNEPIAGARVRFLTGTKDGPEATPEEWKQAAEVVTGEDGDASIPLEIPAVGFAKSKLLQIQTEVDGRLLDASDTVAILSKESPLVSVTAEDGALVPGISQRVELSVRDGWDEPVESDFRVVGDGLDATVRTDARGAGEVTWDVPVDVGASREIGPCAGGVAATLTITAAGSAPKELLDQGAVPVCVPVDRERGARIELGSLVARAGEDLPLKLLFAKPSKPLPGDPPRTVTGPEGLEAAPFSVSVSSYDPGASLAWFTASEGAITLPETGGGVFRVTATLPRSEGPALQAVAKVLVKPRVLPKLTARITGGRLAPGGEVEIEATLVDESGAPLRGSVTAIVNDKFASEDDPDAGVPYGADTRLMLCHYARIRAEDCDAALANDPAQAVNLRSSLTTVEGNVGVMNDPGASARKELLATFRTMLMNLEGAVYQAAQDPARLRDVLRASAKGNEFNPEVLTLVTSVLDAPPTTPGGAPFLLEDLVAIDPQVTYDNVARRVTRLKLFQMLQDVRRFRQARAMDADEPVLGDPNGILRRLLSRSDGELDGATASSALLDPWGGSMQFVKGTASGLPFFEPIPGYKLHAPGPDGKLGTADDVADPFVRILKSGTPYANAMGEDRVVDSRLDMQVADATVDNWSTILTSFTGTQLSSGASGFGSGSGRLEGSHRGKAPQVRMGATSVSGRDPVYELTAPVRTGADGVARLKVRLGADETTYRVLALATVDGAGRAAATMDVSTTLPLSVRVDGGASWVVGDSVSLGVKVTNRTDADVRATVRVEASGAAALDGKEAGERVVDVAARRSVWVNVGARGAREGQAVLVASVEGGGLTDRIEHQVDVRPAGRHVVLGRSRWVSGPIEIPNFSADARTTLEAAPTLVVDPDLSDVVEGALVSLGPDGLMTADGALDSLEGLERARRYAAADKPGIAKRAEALRDRVFGRFLALHDISFGGGTYVFSGLARRARAVFAAPSPGEETPRLLAELGQTPACPPDSRRALSEELREIEGEPIAPNGAVESCWEGLVANVQRAVAESGGRVELARLLLAYSDRPHRKSSVSELADKLSTWVSLDASGAITLPTHLAGDRAARAIVYASLVRATTVGWKSPVPADTLLGWLIVQRAADGGFGSRLATRAAILALTAAIPGPRTRTLTITSLDESGGAIGEARAVEISRGERIPLDAKTRGVRIDVEETKEGVLVRLEQPALLGWATELPADELASPLSLETRWPTAMKVGATAALEVRLSGTPDAVTPMLVRVPLPPGAYLSESLSGVRMVEGAIVVTTQLDPSTASLPLRIPVRFGLAGSFTLGEAWAKGSKDDGVHARTPRSLVEVGPR